MATRKYWHGHADHSYTHSSRSMFHNYEAMASYHLLAPIPNRGRRGAPTVALYQTDGFAIVIRE